MRTIYLDPEDDIVSICDRLTWAGDPGRVVLVLPPDADLLGEYLDLVRLRRHAETLRIEVGLVTRAGHVRSQARALGIAVFGSPEQAERSRRGWWRARRQRRRGSLPGSPVVLGAGTENIKSLPDEADRRELFRRRQARPTWQKWMLRYLGIVLFLVVVALLSVGVIYTLPAATLTLRPQLDRLRVREQIIADPGMEQASVETAMVPARPLTVVASWRADVATTGGIEVPDAPARGTVLFVNRLEEPVTVPAGTQVSTTAGERVVFQVLAPTEVPGAVGGTAEADVVAVEPGPQGNVGTNQINRLEGSLALQLDVRNLEPTSGGGNRVAKAVTEGDLERLRAQVLQYLQTIALTDMEADLQENEFLARDSLRVGAILEETYTHFPGERTDRVALEIRAELYATAVDASRANDLVYLALGEALPPGFELVPESLSFHRGEIVGVDSEGRVRFEMIGEAVTSATFELDGLLERIAGQPPDVAATYLYTSLPLRAVPEVRIWPNWIDRMPYLPMRIRAEVETGL